jgi:hypothetical protein
MSHLSWWQRIILGLALLLPLACNLTTVDPTATLFPTASPTVKVNTATPTATRTVTPTATKPAPAPGPTSKPVFHLTQPLPAFVCSVVPSVDAVNIRSGAGTNFPVIGVMLSGNWVMASRLTNNGWYQIVALGTVVNGGWISSTVVTLQQPCICTPDSCTQSGIVPPTAAPSALPRVGFVGLTPSGAAPCVVTGGGDDVPIFSMPEGLPPQIAILVPHGGLVAFAFQSGRYEVNFTAGSQQLVGWVNANRVTTEGDCAPLIPPTVCSVQPSVGRVINIYAEPKRDAKLIGAMNERERYPFVQFSPDGWFSVNLGIVGSGWIAPDEGVLVGPCDNGH